MGVHPTNARQDYVIRARRTIRRRVNRRVHDENRKYRIINDYITTTAEDAATVVISTTNNTLSVSITKDNDKQDRRRYQLTFAAAGHGPLGP